MFADVLDKKEACKDYKNNCVTKQRKIRIFPKGLLHRFGQKFETFCQPLIFMQNRLTKKYLVNVLVRNNPF